MFRPCRNASSHPKRTLACLTGAALSRECAHIAVDLLLATRLCRAYVWRVVRCTRGEEQMAGTDTPKSRGLTMTPFRWALLLVSVLAVAWTIYAAMRPQSVSAVRVQARPLVQTVVTIGRVRPQRLRMASLAFGRVTEVLVAEGNQVKAGSVLLRLDSREAAASVAEARAALMRAKAERKRLGSIDAAQAKEALAQAQIRAHEAEDDVTRLTPLAAQGVVAKTQLQRAVTARDLAHSALRDADNQVAALRSGAQRVVAADATVMQAEAALALAETHLDYCEVKAPVAATVLQKEVEVGDVLQAGTPILELAADGRAELVAQLDERNLSQVRVGQTALASAEAFPSKRFKGEVSFVAPAVDPQRGTVEVRLRIQDAPSYLRADMTVSIDIEVAQRDNALAVPAIAVRDLAREPYVFIVNNGYARRREVEIGIQDGMHVEIRKGLQENDQVIVTAKVAEGTKVKVETAHP